MAFRLITILSFLFAIFDISQAAYKENDNPQAIPPPSGKEKELEEWQEQLMKTQPATTKQTFKLLYVTRNAITSSASRPPLSVRVRATSGVSDAGHRRAALRVQQMLRFSSDTLLSRLVNSDLGVFAWHERGWGTQFPEFAYLADRPECVGAMRCSGACAPTCTPDGRKWSSIAGLATAQLAVVLEDNVLCGERDPYRRGFSVLVHEFAHTVKMGGLRGTSTPQNILAAWQNARRRQLWPLTYYAMSTVEEYWAEGTTAFFNVNRGGAVDGFTTCGGRHGTCPTEAAARAHLRSRDPLHFRWLESVYTAKSPGAPSNIELCY